MLNTDAEIYGGANVGNDGAVKARALPDGFELSIVIPPLAAVFFTPQG
jgi:1,4-alpha-glucan branching enzyme